MSTAMARRCQHVTQRVRQDIAQRIGGPIRDTTNVPEDSGRHSQTRPGVGGDDLSHSEAGRRTGSCRHPVLDDAQVRDGRLHDARYTAGTVLISGSVSRTGD